MSDTIKEAVVAYIANKVTITVGAPKPSGGNSINPGEVFSIDLKASNGDVELKNVKYKIEVVDPTIGSMKVPPADEGTATDVAGNVIAPGTDVSVFIFAPKDNVLPAGDEDGFTLKGTASNDADGGQTTISVTASAEVDFNVLFPGGVSAAPKIVTLTVVG
jgi:hypothetical protein